MTPYLYAVSYGYDDSGNPMPFGHFSDRIPEVFLDRQFTPAEAARMSGIFPENQRLYRSRFLKAGVTPEFPSAPYDWEQVMQLALMSEIIAAGLTPLEAWKISSARSLVQCHEYDCRKRPYTIFARQKKAEGSPWDVSMGGAEMTFDPKDDWWGDRGHWFNYSKVQKRVVAAYEAIRRGD